MTQQGRKHPVDGRQDSGTTVAIHWSRDMLLALNSDPAVSNWLKGAIRDLTERDPLDALYDAELLCALMKARWEVTCRNTCPSWREGSQGAIDTRPDTPYAFNRWTP